MKEYNGENPQNARINISYTGKKPKVKFSYPVSKKDSITRGDMFLTVFIGWLIINLPLIIFLSVTETEFVVDETLNTILKLLYLLLIPSLAYFPFKKKWDKLYPDYQAWTTSKKYKKFLEKDLQKKGNNYYAEVPLFENVVCDFNATKDFSKYMESFEIEEYKFEYMKRFLQKKKQKNEIIWYARWYFKEKPIKGFLEVIYK